MRWRDAMRDTAEATKPAPQAIERLSQRLELGTRPLHPSLRQDPGEDQLRRVQARIRYRRPVRVHPRLLLASGTLIVGAAVALWAIGSWEPAPVASVLYTMSGPAEVDPSPFVHLKHEGEGWVSGTERDLLITWNLGDLQVEVEPAQGVSLQVATDEASVWVTGTAFSVSRSPVRGTEVVLHRGQVELRCTRGEAITLEAGESHVCLADTPEALSYLATELGRQGAPPQEILNVVDQALTKADSPMTRGTLLAKRASLLAVLGRRAEAREAIVLYHSNGPHLLDSQVDRLERTLETR